METVRDNRSESRAAIMAPIEALWEDETGTPRITPAKLEDKSRGGASIRVKDPINAGSRLTVQWVGGQFSGTVTYCLRQGKDYVLGIQRDPPENSGETDSE